MICIIIRLGDNYNCYIQGYKIKGTDSVINQIPHWVKKPQCNNRFVTLLFSIEKNRKKSLQCNIRFVTLVVGKAQRLNRML